MNLTAIRFREDYRRLASRALTSLNGSGWDSLRGVEVDVVERLGFGVAGLAPGELRLGSSDLSIWSAIVLSARTACWRIST